MVDMLREFDAKKERVTTPDQASLTSEYAGHNPTHCLTVPREYIHSRIEALSAYKWRYLPSVVGTSRSAVGLYALSIYDLLLVRNGTKPYISLDDEYRLAYEINSNTREALMSPFPFSDIQGALEQ
ncbi:hypothetical protein AX14_003178 [Amanita brunnescens Koide BX004]|nr:hypothetical protein AX14_003178 [Amanita brunnescens Koide BX004]